MTKIDRRQFIAVAGGSLLLPAELRAQSAQPLTANVAIEKGRIWIAATLAGAGPYYFVIDTGATVSYLRPAIAKELKLKVVGSRNVRGIGAKTTASEIVMARDVNFGGHLLQRQVAFSTYDFGRGLGDAAGLLAAGILTGADSDLDMDAGQWRIWPDGRPDRTGFEKLDSRIRLSGNHTGSDYIYLTVRIDGRPFKLLADTGAPRAILLFPEAAKSSGLWNDDRPYAPFRNSGFGGAAARLSRLVRVGSVEAGPLKLDRPLITLMDPRQDKDLNADGVIGLEALQMLNLSTDVGGNALWVQRSRRPAPTFGYGHSGLWIDADKGSVVVAAVGTASPAAEAGIAIGDRLVGYESFAAALRAVNGPAGKPVTVRIERMGQTSEKTFTLREYL
ncbi:MAG: hypothetical protein JWR77_119 [Rhizorhabdus sp.]|nr:hypothetical protein [Rhizorhabdus sp.]